MELVLVLLLATTVYGCGTPTYPPNTNRVVNGEEALPHSWPWQALLETFYPVCGATLIAPNWVLTAAHCINFHTYRVVLGDHDQNKQEGPEQYMMVQKMILHPKWNDNCVSCGFDIALLKLEKSAILNDKVQLACLPQADSVLAHDHPCYTTGWGRLSTGGPRPDKLQQGLVPVVEYDVCRQNDWWGSSVKPTMVCVGGDTVSMCHGDSGGPLNCQGRDGKWYVEGVSSFVSGKGCNTPMKPSVFTRVASYIPWISQTMASN
ncbi:chymotrypsin-like elastase family member 3B [Engraulis encrasicolus]|uniref:chymotrypsin-like elastase family member 3B n=1 Tax=Engraulis encrasicolus TaxID=184585 RepID=UPI002FD12A0E